MLPWDYSIAGRFEAVCPKNCLFVEVPQDVCIEFFVSSLLTAVLTLPKIFSCSYRFESMALEKYEKMDKKLHDDPRLAELKKK